MHTAMTLGEALLALTATTGHRWKQYEFFYLVTHCGMRLHAAAPENAKTTLHRLGNAKPAKKSTGSAAPRLAVVFPPQVRELWTTGSTSTEHPASFDHGDSTMEWFTEPVPVTFDSLRVLHSTIKEILGLWMAVKNRTVPVGDLPKWMWIVVHKTRASAGIEDRKVSAQQRASARKAALTRPPRNEVEASQPYVGPAPSTQALMPRVLWLMDHFFETRAAWFTGEPRSLHKSDIKRQVFVRLANDGTRGERRAKVSEATIHKLAHDWVMPPLETTPARSPAPAAKSGRETAVSAAATTENVA